MVEGGTAHGWERSTDQLVCLEVPPAPVYKGVEKGAGQGGGAPWGGVQPQPGVGLPPFLLGVGEGRKRKEGGRKGGPAPLPIRIGLGGARPLLCSFSLLSTKAQ